MYACIRVSFYEYVNFLFNATSIWIDEYFCCINWMYFKNRPLVTAVFWSQPPSWQSINSHEFSLPWQVTKVKGEKFSVSYDRFPTVFLNEMKIYFQLARFFIDGRVLLTNANRGRIMRLTIQTKLLLQNKTVWSIKIVKETQIILCLKNANKLAEGKNPWAANSSE